MNKNSAFEYLLNKFLEWQNEQNVSVPMTKVKALKLLFYVASIPVMNRDLLDIFNKFYAMQYGPVESDIYTAILNDDLAHYSFQNSNIYIKKSYHRSPELSDADISRLDASFAMLKARDCDMIKLSAFDLVQRTHSWSCWKDTIFLSQLLGLSSYKMSSSDIKKCAKEVWG